MYDIYFLLWMISWRNKVSPGGSDASSHSLICTNVHTLQARTIIDEQIGQLGRHFIIHNFEDHTYIVVGEEVNSTILGYHRYHIGGGIRPTENVQRHTEQTIGLQRWTSFIQCHLDAIIVMQDQTTVHICLRSANTKAE